MLLYLMVVVGFFFVLSVVIRLQYLSQCNVVSELVLMLVVHLQFIRKESRSRHRRVSQKCHTS